MAANRADWQFGIFFVSYDIRFDRMRVTFLMPRWMERLWFRLGYRHTPQTTEWDRAHGR